MTLPEHIAFIWQVMGVLKKIIGNTAQLRRADGAARFFVRLYKNFAGLLVQVKNFFCSMTETYSSKACTSICALLPIPFLTVFCIMTVSCSALEASDVSAECAVLISRQTGEVIFQKNAYAKHSMASTTKIMTSLLAAQSGKLHDELTVTEEMVRVEGTSMGLLPGDIVSVKELIYGMLLPSGNDAANATAVYLGGNVENFAKQMNAKAKEIGMENTNFVTPSGLDDKNHYSTAFDMALLGRYAVGNPVFRSVCSSEKATLSYGNPPYNRTLYNHNRLLESYKYALGIKTGFTKKSGRCLVSYAEKDGMGLIAVTLNAPDDWNDHKLMLDYGFSRLKKYTFTANIPKTISVVGGNVENLRVKCNSFEYDCLEQKNLVQKVLADRFVYAPISKGDKLGEVKIYLDGKFIGSTDIYAAENVGVSVQKQEEKSFFQRIKERFTK